jgi:ribonucleoside-diphosphate reductase alpha chain
MEGVSSRGDRISPDAMAASDAPASVAGGTERIAAILSEASIIDAPAGSTHGGSGGVIATATSATVVVERHAAASVLDQSNASLMGDAPACDSCGSITVRNGTCYRCLNCGNSMGCS